MKISIFKKLRIENVWSSWRPVLLPSGRINKLRFGEHVSYIFMFSRRPVTCWLRSRYLADFITDLIFIIFYFVGIDIQRINENIRGGSINSKTIGLFVTCDLDRISFFCSFFRSMNHFNIQICWRIYFNYSNLV